MSGLCVLLDAMFRTLQQHKVVIALNALAVALLVAYFMILTAELRLRVDAGTYRIILSTKLVFFLVPVYLHNLVLVRLLLDKGRWLLYAIGVVVLLTIAVPLNAAAVKSFYSSDVPMLYIISGLALDLLTGAGALFMYRYIHNRHERQQQDLLQRAQELKHLQERLDQHFLFNALNTIYSYIQSNPPLASTLMEQLSSLLRYQLQKSSQPRVSLHEELDFIQSYVLLQETRFSEQARIRFTLEGDPHQLTIAPMLLMPFIENAFKHTDFRAPDATVDLSLVIEGDTLRMSLTNTCSDPPEPRDASLNLGLSNGTKRLALLYPQHVLNMAQAGGMYRVELSVKLST